MKCPVCGHIDSRVIDSRPTEEGAALRRRRHCDQCGARFTTHERVQNMPLMVIKKDGRREEFNGDKLYGGIAKACNKRPVPIAEITSLVSKLESDLRREGTLEVSAERVGEMVMERLIHLDEVAYVRFASVYQQFDDVRRFAQLLELNMTEIVKCPISGQHQNQLKSCNARLKNCVQTSRVLSTYSRGKAFR
jgi:transcriptional repressor NrdR